MSDPKPGWHTLWLRCNVCRSVEGVPVPDDGVHVIQPCDLCGSADVTMADYHPDRSDAA